MEQASPTPLDRILEAAQKRFSTFGYTKVTMEEIAQDLGMSKKTLYKHFANKEDVMLAVAVRITERATGAIEPILRDPALPFFEKLRQVLVQVGLHSSQVPVTMMDDIYKNAPRVWQQIDQFRQQRIAAFGGLIREGIAQGILRQDIDPQLVVLMYTSLLRSMMVPRNFVELSFTPRQVLETVITIMLEGLMTPLSRKEFERTRAKVESATEQAPPNQATRKQGAKKGERRAVNATAQRTPKGTQSRKR